MRCFAAAFFLGVAGLPQAGLALSNEVTIRCAGLFDVLKVEDAPDGFETRLARAADDFASMFQVRHGQKMASKLRRYHSDTWQDMPDGDEKALALANELKICVTEARRRGIDFEVGGN